MLLAAPQRAAALAPAPATVRPATPDVDTSLVAGLKLPKIPGLPDVKTPGLLKLLAPPTPDSLAGKADLLAVKAAQKLRTPAADAWAKDMDERGATKIWFDFAKRHREQAGVVQGWLGTALLASTMAANLAATMAFKEKWDRARPYEVDSSIVPVSGPESSDSYPSGHASSAFAAARVISRLAPDLAGEAYDMARQVAVSRVYSGVHFPSDVVAGALLGTAIADGMLKAAGKG